MLTPAALVGFCAALFRAVGLGEDHARIAADNLVEAERNNIPTHGLSRLGAYLAAIERGVIEPCPVITVTRQGATGLVDGGNGPGMLIAHRAMSEAIDLARAHGIGLVAVRRSNHFGAAGYLAQMALDHGMIGLALSNASATVAPYGGSAGGFGTNPLAFAAPAGDGAPFLLDMATSVAARGQLRLALTENRPIPPDWAVSTGGRPATTAAEALAGVLLPFGGAKGYGIALMVEILSSMLSGACSGQGVSSMYHEGDRPAGVGHAFLAINIAAFCPVEDFTARFDHFAATLRAIAPLAGGPPVRLPGERRAEDRRITDERGIVLPTALLAELDRLADRLALPPLAAFATEDRP